MKEEQTEEKPKDEWIVAEIPETMKEAIVNPKTKEVHSVLTALATLLNNDKKLMKLLD